MKKISFVKKIVYILTGLFVSLSVMAQSGSPASRFGYGEINDNIPGEYRAMGGVMTGMRSNHAINPSQPASYTACDSLSFMFDIAVGIGWTRYTDSYGTKNKATGSLEYVTLQFPIWKRWIAFSAGITPYTQVDYDFTQSGTTADGLYDYSVNYHGKGGLSQVYAGLSFNVLDWFAVGANFYYLFGKVENYTTLQFAATGVTNSEILRYMDMRACRTKVGAQLFHTFAKKHNITLGATFDPKLKLGGDYLVTETYSLDTAVTSTGSEMPMAWSVGASYVWDNRLTIAADYTRQEWADAYYFGQKGFLNNRQKISVGGQYQHNMYSPKYADRMIWRVGASVMNSYTKGSPWQDFSVSMGFGFPLRTVATVLNTTFEYGRKMSLSGMEEHNFKVTIDIAVNEQWFHKRKL